MSEQPAGTRRWTAALVDLDGTLIDTSNGVRAAISAAFMDVTGSSPGPRPAELSLPIAEMIRSLDPTAPTSTLESLSGAFRRQYDATYWKRAQVYPGAENLLRVLQERRIRAFVVTNKRTSAAERVLDHFGLAQYVEGIVGQQDSGDPLPKRELVGRCVARAGLAPASSVMVGDSDQDAAAAASWGMVFVAVTSGAGPLGHASPDEERVEVASLADAAAFLNRANGENLRES